MKRNTPIHLPETIKALSIIFNYSQKYIASCLNVRQSTVSDIENGIITPCIEKLDAMAEIYDMRKEDLLLLGERPPKENMTLALEHLKRKDKLKPTPEDFALFERLSNLRHTQLRNRL